MLLHLLFYNPNAYYSTLTLLRAMVLLKPYAYYVGIPLFTGIASSHAVSTVLVRCLPTHAAPLRQSKI